MREYAAAAAANQLEIAGDAEMDGRTDREREWVARVKRVRGEVW